MRTIPMLCAALFALSSASASVAAPAPAATSTIGELGKTHNLDLGNGSTGMRLMVPADVVGMAGQTVAAVVWFYDAAGQPIRSAITGWGDASNHYRIISRDVVPASARQAVHFDFKVPYCGFPRRSGGRYQVEARVVLVQRVGEGRVVLARRSTTFFVE